MSVLVIGIGNPDRGDDAVGPRVSDRVRELLPDDVAVATVRGDMFALLERMRGADTVLVVDAMRSGAAPGTVRRIELGEGGRPAGATENDPGIDLRGELASFASSHSVDLLQAIELGRSLGRLPARLVLFGIEAAGFEYGAGLSPPVARAMDTVIARIVEECPCTRHH